MSSSRSAAGSVEHALEWHEQQRHTGVAVISCLAGPLPLGVACWRRWCAARNRPVLLLTQAELEAAVEAWAAALARLHQLSKAAAAFLARKMDRSFVEVWASLAAMSCHDRAVYLDGLGFGMDGAVETCGRWLLTRALDEPFVPERLAQEVRGLLPTNRRTWLDVLGVLCELLPHASLPAFLFVADGDSFAAARLLSSLVERAPRLSAALVVEASVLDRYLTHTTESHALALLRDGRINVEALDETTLRTRLEAQGLPLDQFQGTIRRLAADGVDDTLAETFADLIRRQQPPRSQDREGAARSAAERFLFALLEMRPATAGLFTLNAGLGFLFGRKEAEADFFASSLRLVIELDGYYHFQDAEAYRRDRRKDWEMQRHGFTVLRFLSDDVTARLEEMLDTIQIAVDHCRKHSISSRNPPS